MTTLVSFASPLHPQRRNARAFRSRFAMSTLLIAAAALLGLGGGVAHGQSNCPAGFTGPGGYFEAPGVVPVTGVPTIGIGPTVDPPVYSFGIFQIYVNKDFVQPGHDLMNGGTYNGTTYPGIYPGWQPGVGAGGFSGAAGTLSSPVLYDSNTTIGRSAPQQRIYLPSGPGIQVGSAAYINHVYNYSQLFPIPTAFIGATGTREVLTEIEHFTLGFPGDNFCAGPCSIPNVPCYPTSVGVYNMVMAGQHNTDAPGLLASLGMVQSLQNYIGAPNLGVLAYDYPAQSFFNVFAEVHLPQVTTTLGGLATVSGQAFPALGAYLYTDLNHALTVQNGLICALPPGVVYTHTPQTFAVALYFKYPCPNNIPGTSTPWWNQGDPFGWLSLAGHGTTTSDPCSKSYDLQQFVNTVLGPDNAAQPGAPIGWPLANSDFPWPTMTFDSLAGTNPSGLSKDSVSFTQGHVTIYARDMSFGNFQNPVHLPAANGSVIYTNPNTMGTCAVSTDGTNFFPATMNGTVRILINNSNSPVGNVTFYHLQALQWDMTGYCDLFGDFFLRQSTTKFSTGTNIVEQPSPQGGVLAASFLNLSLEFSTDDVSWIAANKPLHHQLVNPPCGAAGEKLHVQYSGSTVVISWWNQSYILQGTPSLSPPTWTTIPGTSPITLSTTSMPYQYYRLACP